MATIILSISKSELVHINNIMDPVKIWKKLQTIYESKGTTSKHFLLQNFYNMKFIEGSSTIRDYINRFTEIYQQLQSMNEPITDSSYIATLLLSLLESYKYLVTILKAQKDLTIEFIIGRLIEEDQKQSNDSTESQINAFATKSTNLKSKSSKANKDIICHHCKKPGHYIKDYWIKDLSKKPTSNQKKANKAETSDKTEDKPQQEVTPSIFSTTINLNQANQENWYLDSCTTNHFAVNKSSFKTYKTLEKPTQVKVANQDYTPAIGTGTVELQVRKGQ